MLKRWLGLVAAGVLLAGLGSTRAEVAVPPLKAHVTDLTGTLSAQQLRDLESRLAAFERGKGSQVAVLMLPSTQPETIEEYSIRVADAWKIGRARAEDGVILVVAKNDRKLRFEVGTGLEGAIPDVIAKRIVSDVIAPHFRSGDFYGGIAAGTDAVMKLIEGEGLPAPQSGVIIKGVHHAIDFQTIFLLFVALVVTDAIFRRLFGRVVGAGISGLSAAVRLANADWCVHVHEATQQAGGRCRSYFDTATNLTIDNGNHLLLSGNRHALAYARSIGTEAGLVGPKRAQFPFVDDCTSGRQTPHEQVFLDRDLAQ